jgi:hypothetical protein
MLKMETERVESSNPPGAPRIVQEVAEEVPAADAAQNPGWRALFREAFNKARREQKPTATRRELGRDRSKSLILVAGGAVLLLLLFFGVFSSPNKPNGPGNLKRPGTPNLGRKDTPGQDGSAQSGKSVTPLLSADLRSPDGPGGSDVTPEDIDRTSRVRGAIPGQASPPNSQAQTAKKEPPVNRYAQQYALSQINVPETALPPSSSTSSTSEDLRKPSLVFVRAAQNTLPSGNPLAPMPEASLVMAALPAGTRLVARLESPLSSAARAPVVAVVEYNYERDGEIVVPAGAKAFGKLEQVNSSGYVGIHFESIEMPDGTSEKIDATAMDLHFGPLKGKVTGKNTGKKFLVSSLTGLGTAAAYLVGSGGGNGLNGPISESALLRERVANNIGIAGDQQLTSLAFNQNIVVTLPGNTRFYLIFQKGSGEPSAPKGLQPARVSSAELANAKLPSLEELRQLMQLRQELSQMYQQPAQPSMTSSSQP